MLFRYSAISDTGLSRSIQQDDWLVLPQLVYNNYSLTDEHHFDAACSALFAVADGMGGGQHGEIASKIVVDSIREYIIAHISDADQEMYAIIHDAIFYANDRILAYIEAHPTDKQMGSTVVLGLIHEDQLHLAWVGDSRCYQLDIHNRLNLLSKDHSYVQGLVDSGKITSEEAFNHPNRNIITQSMGMANILPSYLPVNLKTTKYLLFCSDGLNAMVADAEIKSILVTQQPVETINQQLVNAANNNGGDDNITTILIGFDIVMTPPTEVAMTTPIEMTTKKGSSTPLLLLFIVIGLILTAWFVVRPYMQSNHSDFPAADTLSSEILLSNDEEMDRQDTAFSMHQSDIHVPNTPSDTEFVQADGYVSNYYIRLNVFVELASAQHFLEKLSTENPQLDLRIFKSDSGLSEVCLFGFDSKSAAKAYLTQNNHFPNAVVLYQKK